MQPRLRLGQLLVDAHIVSAEQLEQVLAMQKTDGRRLGTLLVESGLITETQLTPILSQQLSVPWVSLYHIDFSRQLLNLVPREVAERHCLVPIFVRRVRGQGETLYIAMDNPDNESARQEVAQYSGLPVRAMIAPPSDIRGAISAYYGGNRAEEEAAQATDEAPATRLDIPKPVDRTAETEPGRPPAEAASASAAVVDKTAIREKLTEPEPMVTVTSTPSTHPKPDSFPPDSSPQISARDVTLPRARKARGQRMITVTFLDGTQINLPAKKTGGGEEEQVDHADLTARDLVAALRAVTHGADASEVLGENVRWEKLIAALLSVLLKKHLIADWEFVDEYRKI